MRDILINPKLIFLGVILLISACGTPTSTETIEDLTLTVMTR
jgi:hypothetical protein